MPWPLPGLRSAKLRDAAVGAVLGGGSFRGCRGPVIARQQMLAEREANARGKYLPTLPSRREDQGHITYFQRILFSEMPRGF